MRWYVKTEKGKAYLVRQREKHRQTDRGLKQYIEYIIDYIDLAESFFDRIRYDEDLLISWQQYRMMNRGVTAGDMLRIRQMHD